MKTFASRKSLYGMVTAAALSMMLVGPALAQDTGVTSTTATVDAGALTMTDPVALETTIFDPTNITGLVQDTTATLGSFSVMDFTGTSAGWQVSIEAAQVEGDLNLYQIPFNSLSLSTLPTITPLETYGWDPADIVPLGAVDIDTDDTAVELASAALDAGMGQDDFSTSVLTLTLPADILADVYNVDVTLTLAIGPSEVV